MASNESHKTSISTWIFVPFLIALAQKYALQKPSGVSNLQNSCFTECQIYYVEHLFHVGFFSSSKGRKNLTKQDKKTHKTTTKNTVNHLTSAICSPLQISQWFKYAPNMTSISSLLSQDKLFI